MQEFFVLTLVRNPWDRMVSYYHWLCEQSFDHAAVTLAKSRNFSDFLNSGDTRRSVEQAHYAGYVTDNKGVERCDLFARIEHLQSDLAPFERHLGFSVGPIERTNTSPRKDDYRGYFNDNDAALVARMCAADITRFGYSF